MYSLPCIFLFFFFNDTAPTEIYPLPLPDALPICSRHARDAALAVAGALAGVYAAADAQLEHLSAGRAGTGDETYRSITAAVLEVGQALPSQLSDPHLAGQARAIAELAAARHAPAEQRDLVRAGLTPGSHPATDPARPAGPAAVLTVGGSIMVGLATVVVAVALATRISRRLRRLRDASLDIAGRELPAAIAELAMAADPAAVHDAQVAAADRADTVLTAGPSDEIRQVGQTVAAVHRQALRLATAQAIQRLNTAAAPAALARRNQTLVQRQLRALA